MTENILHSGWDPKEAADKVLKGLVKVTESQVKGAHDSHFCIVNGKAYIVYKEKGGAQYPYLPMALKKDLLRLLAWQGLWSEYKTYKKEFSLTDFQPYKSSNQFGEVVVILNNGLAPIRSESALPIFSQDVQRNLRVAFPVYREPKKTLFLPQVSVNQQPYLLETVEDVDALARYSLEQAMAGIMARATARAVVKYNSQHTANESSSIAGLLMTVTNLITERADTRSWTTLPQEIQLQRIVLPVGEHQLSIRMTNVAGQVVDVMEETVVIRPKKSSFVIKHWNTPVPKQVQVDEQSDKHSDKVTASK